MKNFVPQFLNQLSFHSVSYLQENIFKGIIFKVKACSEFLSYFVPIYNGFRTSTSVSGVLTMQERPQTLWNTPYICRCKPHCSFFKTARCFCGKKCSDVSWIFNFFLNSSRSSEYRDDNTKVGAHLPLSPRWPGCTDRYQHGAAAGAGMNCRTASLPFTDSCLTHFFLYGWLLVPGLLWVAEVSW